MARAKRPKRSWLLRWMWVLGPMLTLIVFGGPTLMLHLVTSEAEQCFAAIPVRAEPELPNCAQRQHYLEPLQQLPFIGRPAMRAREEIIARMAVWRYLDAAIGEPSSALRAEHFKPLQPASYMIWEGSMRLRMDEVGPPMPVPEPGALASGTGDRRILDDRAFSWTQHYTETRAMEAVLLEGRLDRAVRLAEHYQGRPNTDLRIRVGALLCAGGQFQRGMDQVVNVEVDRAQHRTANIARNFGAARVVHEACAERGRLKLTPVPDYSEAGEWDHRERVMSMRLRHLRDRYPACDLSDPLACRKDARVSSVLEAVRTILRSDKVRQYRLALFATIAESVTSAAVARRYAMPRKGEPTLKDSIPLVADEWLTQAADAPFVTAERYERAAAHISEVGDTEQVASIIQALFVQAAVGYAQRADLGAADRCIVKAKLEGPVLVIMRANAALIAGDRAEARRRAEVEAPRRPRLLLLRAGLALPDADLARAEVTEALGQADEPELVERIRWLLVSLGVPTRGKVVVESDKLKVPPRYRYTGWPTALTNDAVRSHNVDDTLAVWHSWLKSTNRRESRFHAFSHRGDAPAGLTPLMHAGANLRDAHFTSEQTEIWLDALMAFDARRFPLRLVAFARWRAATWRADDKAAAAWRERYQKLALLSQNADVADLLRAVRI